MSRTMSVEPPCFDFAPPRLMYVLAEPEGLVVRPNNISNTPGTSSFSVGNYPILLSIDERHPIRIVHTSKESCAPVMKEEATPSLPAPKSEVQKSKVFNYEGRFFSGTWSAWFPVANESCRPLEFKIECGNHGWMNGYDRRLVVNATCDYVNYWPFAPPFPELPPALPPVPPQPPYLPPSPPALPLPLAPPLPPELPPKSPIPLSPPFTPPPTLPQRVPQTNGTLDKVIALVVTVSTALLLCCCCVLLVLGVRRCGNSRDRRSYASPRFGTESS